MLRAQSRAGCKRPSGCEASGWADGQGVGGGKSRWEGAHQGLHQCLSGAYGLHTRAVPSAIGGGVRACAVEGTAAALEKQITELQAEKGHEKPHTIRLPPMSLSSIALHHSLAINFVYKALNNKDTLYTKH